MGAVHFSSVATYTGGLAIAAGVVVAIVVVVACVVLARRTTRSVWELLALALPILLIVDVTLLRTGGVSFSPGRAFHWSPDGWSRISYDPWTDQEVLNVLLFVPAGFLWEFFRRRPFLVWLGLTVLSLVIELTQGVTGLGAPDVADLIANSAGAAVGVAVAWVVLSLVALAHGARPSRRAVLTRVALLVLVVIGLMAFVTVGAEMRESRLLTDLKSIYRTSSYEQFQRWAKAEDNGKNLLLTKNVFDRMSVGPDGMRYDHSSVTARYPASFFGVERCVFATWTPGSFSVRKGSGSACTTFMG